MPLFIDARVPVVFGVAPEADDAVLTPDVGWAAAHPAGCACCLPRGPAAEALDALFVGRAKGLVPWFKRVVVTAAAEAAVRAALAGDGVTAARFRAG